MYIAFVENIQSMTIFMSVHFVALISTCTTTIRNVFLIMIILLTSTYPDELYLRDSSPVVG